MAGNIPRVSRQQPITAEGTNKHIDATNRILAAGGDVIQRGGASKAGGYISRDFVNVQNDTGETLDAGGVVQLDRLIQNSFADSVGSLNIFTMARTYKAIKPDRTKKNINYAVPLYPIEQGQSGLCCVSGVAIIRINDDAPEEIDANNCYATPMDDDCSKQKLGGSGWCRVLDIDDNDGIKYAVAELQESIGIRTFLAKITSSTTIATNRWKYAWTEQVIDDDGEGYSDRTDGRTGTTSDRFAINGAEGSNPSSDGVMGNGVDTSGTVFDDNSDLELKSLDTGTPTVTMFAVPTADGSTAYHFNQANGIDGDCA